tara:strand:- start:16721 stop:16984 length:264 start_codon:yes stop_codon:yes gene_type:complete
VEVLVLKQRMVKAMDEFKTVLQFKVFRQQEDFYFWVDVVGALGKSLDGASISPSKESCQALLEKYFVTTVPSEEFGNPGYTRLSVAT